MDSKGLWKPPGYGKSREFRGKSYSQEIGKFPGNPQKIGKFLGNRQIPGENRQISGISGRNRQISGKFLGKIGKFPGNVSKSPEIRFPGATFRYDTGNDFPGEEVRDTGQKPPGQP